jgi:hypothetical protein
MSYFLGVLIMFLIMGFAHLFASFVLVLTCPESNDLIVHFWGGLVEFAIGLFILHSNNYKFSV